MRVIVAIIMGAVALLVSSATASQAAWPGHNGKIAFTQRQRVADERRRITFERGGNVWVMDAGGGNQLKVPAGTWMVFDEYHQTDTATTSGMEDAGRRKRAGANRPERLRD